MGVGNVFDALLLLLGSGVWAGWVSYCVARGWRKGCDD